MGNTQLHNNYIYQLHGNLIVFTQARAVVRQTDKTNSKTFSNDVEK